MVNEATLFILCAICLSIVMEGLSIPKKIYQYPFFMAGIFIGFVLPQAIGLVYGSANIPEMAVHRVLLMSCFCISMCWIGYQVPLPKFLLNDKVVDVNNQKTIAVAIVYMLLSFVFWFLIFTLPNGYGLKLSGTSTGIFTIYLFFARILTNISFVLILIELIKKPNSSHFFLATVASLIPLFRAFFLGRRSDIAFIFIAIGITMYLIRRFIPPRIVIISILFLSMILIPFVGQQRGFLSEKWAENNNINLTERFENLVEGEGVLELRNAALLIDLTANSMNYGWGSLYWDTLVFRYIPAQLVGAEVKNSLYLSNRDFRQDLDEAYGYRISIGSTTTGIGDAFMQFDYFGCLFFAILAILFKVIWHRAYFYKDRISLVIYISITPYAMFSVTHGTVNFIPDFLYAYLLIFPLKFFRGSNTTK